MIFHDAPLNSISKYGCANMAVPAMWTGVAQMGQNRLFKFAFGGLHLISGLFETGLRQKETKD